MNKHAIDKPSFNTDYHQWAVDQARLLREKKLDQLDTEHLAEVIADNPSLKNLPEQIFSKCYNRARLEAEKETGLDLSVCPEESPFSIEQSLDTDFYPQ